MMPTLTVGSCFSGIGGIELGLERTGGFETKWQIEYDAYASAVLKKHWPNVRRYGDIRTVDHAGLERVDIICGGYPCQPFSLAGARGGETDDRHLWPEMLRIIRGVRPRFVLLENVPGHLSLGFGRVLGDLAESGFDAEWDCLYAAAVGARHLRGRLFVIATARTMDDADSIHPRYFEGFAPSKGWWDENDSKRPRFGWGAWAREPDLARVAYGIPSRVDRLKCLGNAVVPQVAQAVGERILRFFETNLVKAEDLGK